MEGCRGSIFDTAVRLSTRQFLSLFSPVLMKRSGSLSPLKSAPLAAETSLAIWHRAQSSTRAKEGPCAYKKPKWPPKSSSRHSIAWLFSRVLRRTKSNATKWLDAASIAPIVEDSLHDTVSGTTFAAFYLHKQPFSRT
jgi:hypothetical protein